MTPKPRDALAEVQTWRRANLRFLASRRGAAEINRLLGYRAQSFLSQMIGPTPRRNISERTARRVETVLDLATGWLDRPHREAKHYL